MIFGCDEAQFGILAELTRVGFAHTDALQQGGGNFVRVTRLMRGTRAETQYQFDIVSPRTLLWLGGREKARDVIRWWKSPALASACVAAIIKHHGYSFEMDTTFRMTGSGELIPGSQKLLKSLS